MKTLLALSFLGSFFLCSVHAANLGILADPNFATSGLRNVSTSASNTMILNFSGMVDVGDSVVFGVKNSNTLYKVNKTTGAQSNFATLTSTHEASCVVKGGEKIFVLSQASPNTLNAATVIRSYTTSGTLEVDYTLTLVTPATSQAIFMTAAPDASAFYVAEQDTANATTVRKFTISGTTVTEDAAFATTATNFIPTNSTVSAMRYYDLQGVGGVVAIAYWTSANNSMISLLKTDGARIVTASSAVYVGAFETDATGKLFAFGGIAPTWASPAAILTAPTVTAGTTFLGAWEITPAIGWSGGASSVTLSSNKITDVFATANDYIVDAALTSFNGSYGWIIQTNQGIIALDNNFKKKSAFLDTSTTNMVITAPMLPAASTIVVSDGRVYFNVIGSSATTIAKIIDPFKASILHYSILSGAVVSDPSKLDKGTFTGTADTLNGALVNKLDKGAFAGTADTLNNALANKLDKGTFAGTADTLNNALVNKLDKGTYAGADAKALETAIGNKLDKGTYAGNAGTLNAALNEKLDKEDAGKAYVAITKQGAKDAGALDADIKVVADILDNPALEIGFNTDQPYANVTAFKNDLNNLNDSQIKPSKKLEFLVGVVGDSNATTGISKGLNAHLEPATQQHGLVFRIADVVNKNGLNN